MGTPVQGSPSSWLMLQHLCWLRSLPAVRGAHGITHLGHAGMREEEGQRRHPAEQRGLRTREGNQALL